MTDLKEKTEEVKETVEHEAKIAVGVEEETDKHARKRQPWMPLMGLLLAAIILGYFLFNFVY